MSAKEQAELYNLNSTADAINVDKQILSPEGIAKHRYVGNSYNQAPPSITEEEFKEEELAREQRAKDQLEMMNAQSNAGGDDDDPPAKDGDKEPPAKANEDE